MLGRDGVVLAAFDIGGVTCGVECPDAAFGKFLASRYREFATTASAEVTLWVEITPPPPREVVASWSGPFARIEGTTGALFIEGPGFRGSFDEQAGRGWIGQPADPAPLETFLTAICAGRLLRAGGFFLHAAALVGEEGVRVFFGPSGSGKTTVAGLVGEGVITDETAAIRPSGGGYRVSGVPWRGQPLSAPLAGLFRLRKGAETSFSRLSAVEAVRQLLPSVFFARPAAPEVGRFLEIAGDLVTRVPCYEMRFTPDRSFWDRMPGRRQRERHDLAL